MSDDHLIPFDQPYDLNPNKNLLVQSMFRRIPKFWVAASFSSLTNAATSISPTRP